MNPLPQYDRYTLSSIDVLNRTNQKKFAAL